MAHSRSRIGLCVAAILALLVGARPTVPASAAADNPAPPVQPLRLIFVHHSTGGNWLASANEGQPYRGLGAARMANNNDEVTIHGFSLLATFFWPSYHPAADFNGDGLVNITDFSLLAFSFSQRGECAP